MEPPTQRLARCRLRPCRTSHRQPAKVLLKKLLEVARRDSSRRRLGSFGTCACGLQEGDAQRIAQRA